MEASDPPALPIVNRNFKVVYRNEYDQVETLEGVLIHPELNGFVVVNVSNSLIAIPKEKVFIMREAVVS